MSELVLRRLLPAAHAGLEDAGVSAADRDRLLGIIERRCVTMQNGAAWQAADLPQACTRTRSWTAPTRCGG